MIVKKLNVSWSINVSKIAICTTSVLLKVVPTIKLENWNEYNSKKVKKIWAMEANKIKSKKFFVEAFHEKHQSLESIKCIKGKRRVNKK